MTSEWKPEKKWNPFNSCKLLSQVERWSKIRRGQLIPAPVLVTVDPTNSCNLNCPWCNAKTVRARNGKISNHTLKAIADFLAEWGVQAVCIAGGGEPTLHHGLSDFIADLTRDEAIRVGVVTNGTTLSEHAEALLACDWVGVSIDAASPETYWHKGGFLDDTLAQCEALIKLKRHKSVALNKPGLGNGVFYKFLVTPTNAGETYNAAVKAKKLGFKAIHFRPAGAAWDDRKAIIWDRRTIKRFGNKVNQAYRDLDDDEFSVYGVTHKFDHNFAACHNFKRCYAVFMTAVFMPPSGGGDGFDLGLCCDRRGDSATTPLVNVQDTQIVADFWGSENHWELARAINPHNDCPRCTYAPHNEIFEQVVLRDNMTHVFI